MALSLKLKKIIVHSNALAVVDYVNHIGVSVVLEPLVLDCNFLMKQFDVVSVTFLRRELNSDAHHMAGIGKIVGCRSWLGCIPNLDFPFVPFAAFAC